MEPRLKRILITLLVLAVASSIIAVMLTPRGPKPGTPAPQQAQTQPQDQQQPATVDESATTEAPAPPQDSETTEPSPDTETDAGETPPATSPTSGVDLTNLTARAPDSSVDETFAAQPLGSFDPEQHRFKVELTRRGAAISSIVFARIWEYAVDRRRAEEHYSAVKAGDPNPPPLPPDQARLDLVTEQVVSPSLDPSVKKFTLPVLAARSITINGTDVHLFDFNTIDGQRIDVWSETAPGTFETVVTNSAGVGIVRITRSWSLHARRYDLQLEQTITNLTDQPLEIVMQQYGPPQLPLDRAPYVDPRRFRTGYLLSPQKDPQRLAEVIADSDMMYWLSSVWSLHDDAAEMELAWTTNPASRTPDSTEAYRRLHEFWPNQLSREDQLELSWFASTNRYFAIAAYPFYAGTEPAVDRSLADSVVTIEHQRWFYDGPDDEIKYITTLLTSPTLTLAAGASSDFNLSFYAGPMERETLYNNEPYRSLNLGGLIFYQLSSFCGFCTFQWLAHWLIWFLSLVHAGTFDWSVAIIILVITVRLILHPITKRAQVSMHRTMKRMAKFKPEMDKLQQKFAHDKKRLQAEQIRLMREHGVNPLGCLGILPILLQTPIWIALYAMLYFAYELRHQPAFWGFFQIFWDWGFLSDLSQADHFFYEFAHPIDLFGFFKITGLNLLPLLMGLVFFVQQKYMTPPTAATMTKEQQQQQKIMRVMMIVLFPIMLYSAPSGLTLYIMTSSILGIIESRMIRRHAEHLEQLAEQRKQSGEGPGGSPGGDRDKKPRKPRDPRGRAYAQMLERMREAKKQQPSKSFKKRR